MKKIVIINGVMGVIGSPIFSFFVEQGENIIYGISRKGLYFDEYVNEQGRLPETNLVFALTDYKSENYEIDIDNFVDALPELPIVFIHTMGEYVTEMSRDGKLQIINDNDGDGINDSVKRLTYDIPQSFSKRLAKRKEPVTFVQIGSLSDKYRIDIHSSWVKSMDLLKTDLQKTCEENNHFHALVLNVSSVLTPRELVDRPFVSLKTNADMRYWLPPVEIAYFINEYIQSPDMGVVEKELYKKWPNISPDHFTLASYRERRGKELYDTLAYEHKDVLALAEGDSIAYSFKSPFHMDRLWGDLTILLSRQYDKNQPIFFYNPHNWFFVVRGKAEHSMFSDIEKNEGTVLLVCGSDTPLDRDILEKDFSDYKHKYAITTGLGFENNYNLNIYGEFIIEVCLDKNTANKVDGFYAQYDKITPENTLELKEIVSSNGDNKITVYKNKEKSEKLRAVLANSF
jgi:hypothetical protein